MKLNKWIKKIPVIGQVINNTVQILSRLNSLRKDFRSLNQDDTISESSKKENNLKFPIKNQLRRRAIASLIYFISAVLVWTCHPGIQSALETYLIVGCFLMLSLKENYIHYQIRHNIKCTITSYLKACKKDHIEFFPLDLSGEKIND